MSQRRGNTHGNMEGSILKVIANTGDDNLNINIMLDAGKAYRVDLLAEALADLEGLEMKELRDFRNEPDDIPELRRRVRN